MRGSLFKTCRTILPGVMALVGLFFCSSIPSLAQAQNTPPVALPEHRTNAATTDSAQASTLMLPVPVADISPDNLEADGVPLLPRLLFLLDQSGTRQLDSITAPALAQDFYEWKHPAQTRQAGPLWLKIPLQELPLLDVLRQKARNESLVLDLGRVPAGSRAWLVPRQGADPVELDAGRDNTFDLLPGDTLRGDLYVHLTGLPGLWFSPVIRPVSQALFAPERQTHTLGMALLAMLALLCVVRSVAERREGRLWAGFFAAAALAHAWFPLPAMPGGLIPSAQLPGIVGAGLALLLLPHVGRIIMSTDETSPITDNIFLALALPGAALALLPMIPGLAWTSSFLDLWPLGALLCALVTVPLTFRHVPGCGLYIMACLSLAASAILALWGWKYGALPLFMNEVPLLGAVLATFFTAAAPRYVYAYMVESDDNKEQGPGGESQDQGRANHALSPEDEWAYALSMEENLRPLLDTLLRESCALDQALDTGRDLPREEMWRARLHSDQMVAACRGMSALIGDIPRLVAAGTPEINDNRPFNLRRLVQDLFVDIQERMPGRQLGLAWYIAPHMGLMYKGDRDRIYLVLNMLLMDAVRATRRGMVSLRVSRADMSPNPGHLQFTVSDSGSGTPPVERGSLMLARVWELATAYHGTMFVDSTPLGVEVTFSLDCVALQDDGLTEISAPPSEVMAAEERREALTPDPALVIIASPVSMNRQMFSFYLREPERRVWEARDSEEALALYTHTPASLVIFDCRLPEEEIIAVIAAIRAFEGAHDLPAVPFLGLYEDDTLADRLYHAGCDHFLPLPVQRGEFRRIVENLAAGHALPRTLPEVSVQRKTEHTPSIAFIPVDFMSDMDESSLEEPEKKSPEPVATPEPLVSKKNTAPATTPSFVPMAMADPEEHSPEMEELSEPSSPEALPVSPVSEPVSILSVSKPASAAVQNLYITPPPPKKLGWLSRMLKPTPHVPSQEEVEPFIGGAVWVGSPTPVSASQPQAALTLEADTEANTEADTHDEELPLAPELPGDAPREITPNMMPDIIIGEAVPENKSSLTFLSLNPEEEPHAHEEFILELTEKEMLNSSLLQQVPDLLPNLDLIVAEARLALMERNANAFKTAMRQAGEQAEAFGLRAVGDLARFLIDAAEAQDFENATQLLAELETEIERNRNAG